MRVTRDEQRQRFAGVGGPSQMSHGWTQDDVDAVYKRRRTAQQPLGAAIAPTAKPSKYLSQKTVLDGITFDSVKEATRYQNLKLLEHVGAIRDLELQPKIDCYGANGERVCGYRGDFRYFSLELGRTVIEDVKSQWTRRLPVYRIKMKLLRAQGITVTEV